MREMRRSTSGYGPPLHPALGGMHPARNASQDEGASSAGFRHPGRGLSQDEATLSAGLSRGSSSVSMSRQSSNPMRLGIPRRDSNTSDYVAAQCRELGGSFPIQGILVANNGIAAVKFMRSLRNWMFKTFHNDRAISLVVMATPEDMRIDAEHVRMADQFVEVPGGANNNNYANVPLIVGVADRAGVDAVWPGWGHASEKPELPTALSETHIRFLGPGAQAMAALGDKIGSTILAQAAGVPTIPWSGSGVSISFEDCHGNIPAHIYDQACVHNMEEALKCCNQIGYPVMLKASWGGGGKGIRKVMNDDDTSNMFMQVQGEVPGSPIFAMKLAPASRHLEVQLLADTHGNVVSLFSRDCSVQRRHQKIVEEGPVTKAPPEVLTRMEACARALAKSVGYTGAATVEYLYSLADGQFYFLELNPRLQVEHPVTEWISNVNIPSCQVMIGMGIPLHRIPDIRALYGCDPQGTSSIDFEKGSQLPPHGHVIAVRVTSEDANDGFKPTCGSIEELSFRTSPDVWGYFSVKSGGGIHEFSDSQFGHLFAKGDTREAAIRAMVVALKEVKIRGEIRNTVDYTADMIQSPDFVGNNIHTGWLDNRIATNVKAEKPLWYLAIISGAVLRTLAWVAARSAEYLGHLQRGQLPPARLTLTTLEIPLVMDGFKYIVKVTRQGPQAFRLFLGPSQVDVVARTLNDGGLLVQVDGHSHVVHSEEESGGTRLMIDSLHCLLSNESDPSRLLATSPGKLMKCLLEDGDKIAADQPYAEIEVMKMIMVLISPAAGRIHYELMPGAVMKPGELIARLELDNPDSVTTAQPFQDGFPELGPPLVSSTNVNELFKQAFSAAQSIIAGYEHNVHGVLRDLLACLDHPELPMEQWMDVIAVVQTRLPKALTDELEATLGEHQADLYIVHAADEGSMGAAVGSQGNFPAGELLKLITEAIEKAPTEERKALRSHTEGLTAVCHRFRHGKEAYARSIASELLAAFLDVEERFCHGDQDTTEQEVIDGLRQHYSNDLGKVMDIVISHQALPRKMDLIGYLLNSLVLPAPELYRPLLRRLAALGGGAVEMAGRASILLEQSLLGELRTIVARTLSGLEMFNVNQASLDLRTSDQGNEGPIERGLTISEGLYSGLSRSGGLSAGSSPLDHKIGLLVEAPAAVEDALASLLDDKDAQLQTRSLLTYICRIYHPFCLREPREVHQVNGISCALWLHNADNQPASASLLSCAVLIPSLDRLYAAAKAVEAAAAAPGMAEVQRGTLHVILTEQGDGALKLSEKAAALRSEASTEAQAFTLSTFMDGGLEMDVQASAAAVCAEVKATARRLDRTGFGSVSVLLKRDRLIPLRIGFWRNQRSRDGELPLSPSKLYIPDVCLSAVEPLVASLLELQKLSVFDRLVYSPSRNRQSHTFTVLEKQDARSLTLKRVFLRALVRQLGKPALLAATYKGDAAGVAFAAVEELESAMVSALQQLNRLYLAPGEREATRPDWAHIFHVVLPALPLGSTEDASRIAAALRAAAAAAMARHSSTLRRTAVAQWEVRLRVNDGSGAWRLVVSLPTGHETGEDNIHIYREAPSGEGFIYKSVHSAGPSERAGPLHGQDIVAPYPPLERLQQKRLAARRHKTTFCYDFPSVFQNALRSAWTDRAVAGEPGEAPRERLVEEQELVMSPGGTFKQSAAMTPVERPVGQNDVGVIAWELLLRTPEYPQGRKIVAIANDITFNSGAFGPQEDAVFKAATEHALAERLPLVYLAANSGARVGLATEVKKRLQVAWNVPEDPSKGLNYLWLTDADHTEICKDPSKQVLRAERRLAEGEVRWVLSDVVGSEDGLGVECLSGSGAIASAYARAFREGFTITLVSGRTVGIGAYLARLGRRCVQRVDQPVILTGFAALNKLLGREVYTSQLQLGGPKVMGVNGVSHHVVTDDLAGISAVLQWLSYTPDRVGGAPPMLLSRDPVARGIDYAPGAGERLDALRAIAGSFKGTSHRDSWQSGLFDKGTWCECQAGWGRSVITGRARLGGVPVGVIAVETNTVMLHIPADPGAPDSSERDVPQAGQVWFPDSAYKTANAMEEFDREGLPLIILANWRGFSGGQRDLFEGVLQAGSLIVESLRTYRQPVTIYLPPGAELRGGAWVVIDSQINAQQVEVYADPAARAGVLEPEGIVEIKFKKQDLLNLMQRVDPELAALRQQTGAGLDSTISARQKALLPIYHQVAVAFAEMHDTPVRMMAKGVLHGIIPWAQARPFLALRLRRRLAEEEIIRHIMITDTSIKRADASQKLQAWFMSSPADILMDDSAAIKERAWALQSSPRSSGSCAEQQPQGR
ncbi:hypothetical protein WJX73_008409 [Symbiochloris irregularis]|uniref:Acetyl-CoA carboxylase n=1 Tax=Symbiochloris irregularis TaxID=706552 RepID=A0AAW1NY51_9CHLO